MSGWCMQTKCKLTNIELFLKPFYIQSKETGNKNYYEEARVIFRLESNVTK